MKKQYIGYNFNKMNDLHIRKLFAVCKNMSKKLTKIFANYFKILKTIGIKCSSLVYWYTYQITRPPITSGYRRSCK